ncbi:MAG: biotin/lipoyl-binding protein [Pseudomonadota bacterium]
MSQEINQDKLPSLQLWVAAASVGFGAACFIFWSVAAQITTTLELSGVLDADQAKAKLQPGASGEVSAVFVKDFEHVAEGDPLLAFDLTVLDAALKRITAERERLSLEDRLIQAEIAGNLDDLAVSPSVISNYYTDTRNAHLQRISLLHADLELAETRLENADAELRLSEERLSVFAARLATAVRLSDQGLIPQTDLVREKSSSLEMAQDVAGLQSAKNLSETEARRVRQEIQQVKAERIATLSTRRAEIAARMDELNSEAVELGKRRENSKLLAPMAGTISDWNIIPGQILREGEEIAQITSPIERVEIALRVPAPLVDQVFVGQKGQAVFATLPQRGIPKTHIEVLSRSDSASSDPNSGEEYFLARAAFTDDSFADLLEFLDGEFHLALDIPVQVILEGRSMTFGSYLAGPVETIVRRALQD